MFYYNRKTIPTGFKLTILHIIIILTPSRSLGRDLNPVSGRTGVRSNGTIQHRKLGLKRVDLNLLWKFQKGVGLLKSS